MKSKQKLLAVLMGAFLIGTACQNLETTGLEVSKPETNVISKVDLTDQQKSNYEKTGSIFLENELENSHNTLIAPGLHPLSGVFNPLSPLTGTRAHGVNPAQNRFWTVLRITYDEAAFDDTTLNNLYEAITKIEDQTNVRFYVANGKPTYDPVYGFEYPRIHIAHHANPNLNSSAIGRVGSEQKLYLQKNAPVYIIMRMLCHAAGMFGEQCRPDRDKFLTIDWKNMIKSEHYLFNIEKKNFYTIGTFDANSIMLTSSYELSINKSKPCVTKKNKDIIAPNTELSDLDRSFLNTFYLPYYITPENENSLCIELYQKVYKGDNTIMSEQEREQLLYYLNQGRPCN